MPFDARPATFPPTSHGLPTYTHRAMLARYAEVPPVAPPEPRWRIYWPSVAVWIGLPVVAWWLVIVAAKALTEAALVAAGGV